MALKMGMTLPHPGRIVRQECIEASGLDVSEAARVLGVTRQALNNLVTERAGISPEMAIRLEQAFGGRGCKPEPPKIPSFKIQFCHDRIQVDDLPVATEGVVSVQMDM